MGGTIDQSEALAILVLQQQENSSQPRPAVDIIPRTVDSFITADPLLEPVLWMQQQATIDQFLNNQNVSNSNALIPVQSTPTVEPIQTIKDVPLALIDPFTFDDPLELTLINNTNSAQPADTITGMNLGIGLAIGGNLNDPFVPALAIATSNSNQQGNNTSSFGSTSITPDFLGGYNITQPGQIDSNYSSGFGSSLPSLDFGLPVMLSLIHI